MTCAIRVCGIADIECFKGCGSGACKRETGEAGGFVSTAQVGPGLIGVPLGGAAAMRMAQQPARDLADAKAEIERLKADILKVGAVVKAAQEVDALMTQGPRHLPTSFVQLRAALKKIEPGVPECRRTGGEGDGRG